MERSDLIKAMDHAFRSLEEGCIYRNVITDIEKILIEKTLNTTGGNQILASRILGLNRNTLRAKIKKHHIVMEKFKL